MKISSNCKLYQKRFVQKNQNKGTASTLETNHAESYNVQYKFD